MLALPLTMAASTTWPMPLFCAFRIAALATLLVPKQNEQTIKTETL